MSEQAGTDQFAALLRTLKNRTDRSYEALAKRTGVSSSSLHRYCAGSKLPPDFGVVQRFARECGATREEMRDLHRLWAVATTEPEPAEQVDQAPRGRRRWAVVGMVVAVLAAGGVLWGLMAAAEEPEHPPAVDGPLLLSAACPPVISMGQHDECAREVQVLLEKAGATVSIDGDFGPETLRRVTAFQVLAGLQPRGVVDEATKHALYEQRVRMTSWTPEQVERRIREVFPEEPDRAVGIARCQSFLDPLYVLVNTNGTRNWGVFQLSDTLLKELGGTPSRAYDPEWNIQAARQAWSRHRDFRDWRHCDQPFRTTVVAGTP